LISEAVLEEGPDILLLLFMLGSWAALLLCTFIINCFADSRSISEEDSIKLYKNNEFTSL
jgi:hypothetical protein